MRILRESVMPRTLVLTFLFIVTTALTAPAQTLWSAVSAGDAATARDLISKGANVNAATRKGTTLLIHAAELGHMEIVKMLIANGADVNAKCAPGYTALILAADNGHEDVVQALIDSGANVNARDNSGGTALQYARTADIARMLESAGATQ